MRIFTTFYVTGNILEHHNRIIDHHTDGNGERTQGDDIDRRIGNAQIDKRHNQGDRDSDTDDDRCTPLTEEEQHNQHDEQQRVQHRLLQRVHTVLDVVGEVVDLVDLYVRGELLLNLCQLFAYIVADLHGVGTGLLGDDQTHGLASVGLLVQAQILDSILDGGNVTDEDLLSLRGHGNHQILNLRALDVLASHLHLILLLRHLDGT